MSFIRKTNQNALENCTIKFTECMYETSHLLLYKQILYTSGILLCILVIIINICILIRIFKTRRLRKFQNGLRINLIFTDFLLGVSFLFPSMLHLVIVNALKHKDLYHYNTIKKLLKNSSQLLMTVMYIPIVVGMLVSILTLTLLAIKRYLMILHPFWYIQTISNRFKTVMCWAVAVIWIVSILVTILPVMVFYDDNECQCNKNKYKCEHDQIMGCIFHRVFRVDCIIIFTSICVFCTLLILLVYVRIYIFSQQEYNKIERRKSDALRMLNGTLDGKNEYQCTSKQPRFVAESCSLMNERQETETVNKTTDRSNLKLYF